MRQFGAKAKLQCRTYKLSKREIDSKTDCFGVDHTNIV